MSTDAIAMPRTELASRPVVAKLHEWVTTVDHKRLGILYIIYALVFLLIAGIEATVIRIQLIRPHNDFVSPQVFNRLFTMHGKKAARRLHEMAQSQLVSSRPSRPFARGSRRGHIRMLLRTGLIRGLVTLVFTPNFVNQGERLRGLCVRRERGGQGELKSCTFPGGATGP
jgi:hypothetical protein